MCFFFFQAEDGIRDLVRSRGLGDVYKRQGAARRRIAQTENDQSRRQRQGKTGQDLADNVHSLSLIHI